MLPPAATADKTIRDDAGEILLFSWPDLVAAICEGKACFICGRTRAQTPFNDEHIVPNWVLHAFKLHQHMITLPNGNPVAYGNYKIPCCQACNSEMSTVIEQKMAPLIKAGSGAIQDHMAANGSLLPYTWMALIFLKLHLNDRRMRMHLDRRLGDAAISEDYVWEHFHHLHAVARAFHIGAEVQIEATGSMFVFPVDGDDADFDLHSFTEAQTLYLQLGRTGLIALFDDACGASNGIAWILEKITGPLSKVQARELTARFAMANLDLTNRPRFWTWVSADRKTVKIGGATDDVPIFQPFDRRFFGHMMAGAFRNLPTVIGMTADEVAASIAAGELSFLFDAHGEFIPDHARSSSEVNEGD